MSIPPGSSSASLAAQNVSAGYGKRHVLQDVSFEIGAGEFAALVGANGCGKTTLLRVVSRVLKPSSGRVLLSGNDLYAISARKASQQIAFVPQEEPPVFAFPVREIVGMGRTPHWGSSTLPTEEREVIESAMKRAGVDELAERPITELSGGERQRVIFARALAQDAPLFLLDEPLAHLDIGHQVNLLQTLRALINERKLGVLCAIHDLNQAAEHADRLLVMRQGKLICDAPPEQTLQSGALEEAYQTRLSVFLNPVSKKLNVSPSP